MWNFIKQKWKTELDNSKKSKTGRAMPTNSLSYFATCKREKIAQPLFPKENLVNH